MSASETSSLPASITELVATDPLLRLHCVGPLDAQAVAGLERLTRPGALGFFAELPRPLDGLIDLLITPLALCTRIAVDRYGVLLRDAEDPRFELGPDGRPTGRVVVAGMADGEVDAWWSARLSLAETARRLGAAFSRDLGADPLEVGERVAESVERQFRFLSSPSVRRVGGHHVAREQHDVLTDILRRVEESARGRRADVTRRQPAVMLDVDLCALVPRERTVAALREVGRRWGIAEFVEPRSFEVLPTYHPPSWENHLDAHGLRERYPDVDFAEVYRDFYHRFFNPWERMRSDVPAPGLARFVWDVHDVGGVVVFNTGRRERVREHTEHALARAGIGRPRLVMLPDDRTRDVHELKAENLDRFEDLEIVAVFDDLAENRKALAKRLPQALLVAVELPGFTAKRLPYQDTDDGAAVVSGFETVPRVARTLAVRQRAGLSHSRSLAELSIGELVDNRRAAAARAARLSRQESLDLVAGLLSRSDDAADRIGEAARAASGGDPVAAVYRIVTRERFRKGPRGNFPLPLAEKTIGPFVARGEPITTVTFGFPVKLHYNELKTTGFQPDLAELGALVRLRELQRAVRRVYPPGLALTVLTDGGHFEDRPTELLRAYQDKLAEYRALADPEALVTFADVGEVALARYGAAVPERRSVAIAETIAELEDTLRGLDIAAAPYPVLHEATARCAELLGPRGDGTAMPPFIDLFPSLLYAAPVPHPAEYDRASWSALLFADIVGVADPAVPAAVRDGRREVLARGWRRTIRYLATLAADREFGYDDALLFPGRLRLTPNPRPGSLGFTYLGGVGLLPWHGTGAVDVDGRLSSDFAVALSDRGYVPVHSPLLGAGQPWFLVPSTSVDAGRLDPALAGAVHLRRR